MTIKHSRAQRRHDRARLKEKRQFHWGYGHKDEWVGRTPDIAGEINHMSPRNAGMVVNTPAPCSCDMCGNPRSTGWDGPLTMQERKALESFKDQIEYATWSDNFYEYDLDDFDDYWWFGLLEEDPVTDWYLRWMYIK